ncbi:hypothetical protein EPN54_04625 [bacterium]|nr:MAG: hypothetical protein EPN54_04625 [bacterium]
MVYLRNYVDPGSGFIFGQGLSIVWVLFLGFFGVLLLFFRGLFRFLKKFFLILVAIALILYAGGLLMHKNSPKKKVIIIGIDAMDPGITEKLIQEGRLPNFSSLKKNGTYAHLRTTNPAESVVAWTSFATGLNPGGHGIFDFIMRDPNTYLPYLSLNEIYNDKGKTKVRLRRKGKPFWEFLSEHNIPGFVYFCPNTFPPQPFSGRMISGMGVPDITGTMGRFSFYTTKILSAEDKDSRGRVIPVVFENGIIHTEIYGPKVASKGGIAGEGRIPFKIILHPDTKDVVLEFQGNKVLLKEKTWSHWVRVSFSLGPFKKAHGIVKYYLKSIHPELELYMSPVNFDPQKPLFPVSYPKAYSAELVKKIGFFYTQGMPHDTWALTEGRLDEQAFLEQVDDILMENEKILNEGLKDFKNGAFFYYFEVLDAVQHMFWRYLDTTRPLYAKNSAYQDTIYKYYEKMDKIVGSLLKRLDRDTILIVLSDHGFGSFRKAVNINRWLLANGYLFLSEAKKESGEFFENVDWSRTKAYALGFGGIYLNRIGREYYGIVSEVEAKKLKSEIINRLEAARDPQSGEKFISKVYSGDDIFSGRYQNDGPDLFVGFNTGYRASWQTALGGVPAVLIENNDKKWSGDHLIDYNLVPGVIFVNKKTALEGHSIVDVAPTVLGLFRIAQAKEMPGKSFLEEKE